MADGLFSMSLVTPEGPLFTGMAREVVLRTSDGNLTVLDRHTPLVADVAPGEVRVEQEEGEALRVAVQGGYLQVDNGTSATSPPPSSEEGRGVRETEVTLLAGQAERADEIDVAAVEEARAGFAARVEELRARLGAPSDGEGQPYDPELAEAENELAWAEVRLAVAAGN